MYSYKKHLFIFKLFIGLFLVILTSCATTDLKKMDRDFPPQIQTIDDVKISVSYLNEKELREQFGKINNPFISPPSALGLNNIMTFHVQVENSSQSSISTYIQLNRIELQFAGKVFEPINRFHLYNFWELKIKNNEDYFYWSPSKVNLIIKDNVFPNSLSISPGEKYTYLLTFMGRFPKYGQAQL